jgi:hypothetical protein
LIANYKWVTSQAAATHTDSNESAFWAQAALVLEQFNGMIAGYNAAAPKHQVTNDYRSS